MTKLDIDAIRKLSVAERLGLIDQIWESLSDDPDAVSVSEEHLAAAHGRLAAHDADPSSAIPWEQAEKKLRARA
jgi:putative addiction module component (TIGR02574 family)